MPVRGILIFVFSFITTGVCFSQIASVQGKIINENNEAVDHVTIHWPEGNKTMVADSSGNYKIDLPSDKKLIIFIKRIGYKDQEIQIKLKPGETRSLDIRLEQKVKTLDSVIVEGNKNLDDKRNYVSTFKIDPKIPKYLPSAFGDFNKILATVGLGVVTNSELSSQYAVRGGNFDENLVYVNDIEIYRPFLVRAGQQEGLSFVNPDMVSDIEFSAGGWQAKYGDKLSSVLAIKYKEPKKLKASVTASLLGGSIHAEGSTKNERITIVVGARDKSSQYLLNTLPTQGQYKPRFIDVQSYVTFDLTKRKDSTDRDRRTTLGILTSYANNRYLIAPTTSKTNFGTADSTLSLDINFQGQEILNYDTYQNGIKFSHRFKNNKLKTDFILSGVHSTEREYSDVNSEYKLSQVNSDPSSANFNQSIFVKGTGAEYDHSRNKLEVNTVTLAHKGYYYMNDKNAFEWGASLGKEIIQDNLSEYSFSDSAQYVKITNSLNSGANLNTLRTQGYLQHTFDPSSRHSFTYGARFNHSSLNHQLTVSPRAQYSFHPKWKRDMLFKASAGIYQQSPFYREMRDFNGNVNTNLKAQTSYHFIIGFDYNFKISDRKFKFISEVYYKYMTNIVPYDMDNVRLRYYAKNDAIAYAMGADFRISGEFIKGEQSWFSLSFLSTKEDVNGTGYIRRPTDQLMTAGIFFQDHIPNIPSLKVFVNLVYGSGLPFGPPNNPLYRAALSGQSYNRVDIGFSKLITFQDKNVHNSKVFESLWISLEVLNLLGISNTISYSWIADYNGNQYAVPNTLSQRFVNLRMIAKF